MNWDDLRIFSAVANAGSLSGAALDLGVNHSTVFRRINTLEATQNVRLFERIDRRYLLTAEGEEMKRVTDHLTTEIDRLERNLSGHDMKLSGNVRVTTTDTLLNSILGPHLARFTSRYPGINLEIIVETQRLNLTKREADVAIRPTNEPPETLIGKRVSDLAFGIYGSETYLSRHGDLESLSAHSWLGFEESLSHLIGYKWMQKNLDHPNIVMTANNFFGLYAGALSHLGLAVLPCFMGDNDPALTRLEVLEPRSRLWVLTHADLRKSARIRVFMDFMYEALADERDLLEGRYSKPKERKSVSRVAASKNR